MKMSKDHQNHSNHSNHYTVMFFIMIISGFLSTMNIWVNNYKDIRFSLNDVYMVFLMTGWMFFLMGIYYKQRNIILIGAILIIANFWCIRTQFMIDQKQYLLGMIPHHSMAVLMSERLLEKTHTTNTTNTTHTTNTINTTQKTTNINAFLENIVKNQSKEIEFMKHKLN